MRRILVNGCVGFLTAWCAIHAAATEGSSRLQFDRTVHDFGTVSQIETAAATFTFRNTGDGIVRIERTESTCGCTVARITADILQPGESGQLAVTFKPVNLSGALEKQIAVLTNDPLNPVHTVIIKANIRTVFEVKPTLAFLGDIESGAAAETTVEVKRIDGQKLAIKKAVVSGVQATAELKPVENSDGKTVHVHLRTQAEGKPHQLTGMLSVYTDDVPEPVVLVPLYGRIVTPITIDPLLVTWDVPDAAHWASVGAKTTTRRLSVFCAEAEEPLKLSNFSSDVEGMLVRIVTLEAGRKYEVHLKLAQPVKESLQGYISFDTNLPSRPTLEVPIAIRIGKSKVTP
jgi:hypothetical protein